MKTLVNDLSEDVILVLEDEIFIAMSIEATLTDAGAKLVQVVTTLHDAQLLLSQMSFSAAILDVRLPDGQSYDLARELLSKKTRVVFHSGHADEKEATVVPEAAFCAKPSTPRQILDALETSKSLIPKGMGSFLVRGQSHL